MLKELSIQISAGSVAWYGAIVATIGFVLSLYVALRDRAKVKVTLQSGIYLHNVPGYDPEKPYLNITVKNKGRRPVKISTVGVKYYGKKGWSLVSDSILQLRNTVLTEENPRTNFFIEEDEDTPTRIYYVIVYDEIDNKYKAYFYKFPTLKLVTYFFLDKFKSQK